MPPTLKTLEGHIAFGSCVRGCVTVFVPTVTFELLKFHIWIPHKKIADTSLFFSPCYLLLAL